MTVLNILIMNFYHVLFKNGNGISRKHEQNRNLQDFEIETGGFMKMKES